MRCGFARMNSVASFTVRYGEVAEGGAWRRSSTIAAACSAIASTICSERVSEHGMPSGVWPGVRRHASVTRHPLAVSGTGRREHAENTLAVAPNGYDSPTAHAVVDDPGSKRARR